MVDAAYQPATDVLERLRQVDFVAVVGPTAVGKSTLIARARALSPQLHEVMNNTSRAPRPGEQDGVDFNFKTREEMQIEMARHRYAQVMVHPSGDLYATRGEDYPTEGVALLPVLASVIPVFRGLPFKRIRVVYVLPPSFGIWMQRLESRQLDGEQRTKRLAEAQQSLAFAVADTAAFFIINDDLEMATIQFSDLVLGDVVDEASQRAGRVLAKELLAHISV